MKLRPSQRDDKQRQESRHTSHTGAAHFPSRTYPLFSGTCGYLKQTNKKGRNKKVTWQHKMNQRNLSVQCQQHSRSLRSLAKHQCKASTNLFLMQSKDTGKGSSSSAAHNPLTCREADGDGQTAEEPAPEQLRGRPTHGTRPPPNLMGTRSYPPDIHCHQTGTVITMTCDTWERVNFITIC